MDKRGVPESYLLATLPAGPTHKRRAFGVLVVSTLIFLVLAPLAKYKLTAVPAFIPLYQSALVVIDIITAALLLGQMNAEYSRSLAILSFGYLFAALITVAHTLSFPGLFAPNGLLGAGMHTTAWLYMLWHAIFPLFVIAYATMRDGALPRGFVALGMLAVAMLVGALILLAGEETRLLPNLMQGSGYAPSYLGIVTGVWALNALAIAALWRKPKHNALDLWMIMVMMALMFEIALAAMLNAGRFDVGFYAGRIYGFLASLFALYVLLLENSVLHSRLYTAAAEVAANREREAGNRLLESILRQLPQAVIVLDGNGKCLMANDQAAHILEISEGGRAPGKTLESIINGEGKLSLAWEHIRLSIRRAAAGETFRDEETTLEIGADARVLLTSGASVRDREEEIVASVVVFDDITKQKNAEISLRHALAQMHYLIENTPLAVIEWNKDFIVTIWNKRAENLFGWKSDEVLGRRIDAFPIIEKGDENKVADVMHRLLDPQTNYVFSANRNRTKDGRTLQAEWHNSVLHDEKGAIVTVFSLVLDVTDRELAMEQLREADRRKDIFIATLAHELRNPLAPIYNAAELMRMKRLPADRMEWVAGMIDRQTALMSRLLDDLLDVSRITSGKIQLRKTMVDVAGVIRNAIDTSRPLIESANHRLDVKLSADPVFIEADEVRLAQVFTNLINNAAKYTEPGGRIEVALAVESGCALATISDSGIGIEPGMQSHVFEPFVQADRGMRLAQGGLGIGLSLAKGLVELHGGTIAVHSEGRGRGSKFSIRLPLPPIAAIAQQKQAAFSIPFVLDKTVLIADDNADVADSLAAILEEAGAKVMVTYDGAHALEMFQKTPADIAILDIGMPFMNGLEVASRLSQAEPRPYLVAITGWGNEKDRIASMKSGFDKHLTKPVSPAQMQEALQDAVQGTSHFLCAKDGEN